MTDYQIHHITDYTYEDAASLSYNEAHLLPRSIKTMLYNQQVTDAQIQIEPGWNDYSERQDFFGNRVIYYTVRQPHTQIAITASSRVRVDGQLGPVNQTRDPVTDANQASQPAAFWLWENADQTEPWEDVVLQMRGELCDDQSPEVLDAQQFCLPSPLIPVVDIVAEMANVHFWPRRPIVEATLSLMTAIFNEFDFVPDATDVTTPISEVMEKRQGVCQDFAQLMICALRCQGLAARYMSGYIESIPPAGEIKLEGSDASHAWCSLYVPKLGWIDFDPTNNLLPIEQHVILGWGRDFGDVTPIKGVYYGGNNQTLNVSVDMKRMNFVNSKNHLSSSQAVGES